MRLFKQQGCKTWRVRFWIEGREFDLPLKTRNKEVAEKRAKDLIEDKELELAGLPRPKRHRELADTPLLSLLDEWLQNGLRPGVKPKHRAYSRNRPTRVFEQCGWRYLRDVSAEGFEAWRNRKAEEGMKSKTLNAYLSHMRKFFEWLETHGKISVDPLERVTSLPVPKSDSPRAFTPEELESLLACVLPYREYLYTIAAYTVLRRNELKTLEWNRLREDGEITWLELNPENTKNGQGGLLPLHPEAVAAFAGLRELCDSDSRLVFYKGITQMRRFRKDLAEAEIVPLDERGRGLEFHSLRRTWATLLSASGVSPQVAQQLMRHSDFRLTLKSYTDHTALPLIESLKLVPSIKSSRISSCFSGKTCPNESKDGKTENSEDANDSPKSPVTKGSGTKLTDIVPPCPKEEMADRVGFEPTVPLPAHTLSRRAH
jgi:integrase